MSSPPTSSRRLTLACAALLVGGCAHSNAVATSGGKAKATSSSKGASPANAEPLADATGVWDWVLRAEEGGNVRVEQEEWHLTQTGATVAGYYDRAITVISTDERLFRCNQQLSFTRFTRVRIQGSVTGKTVRLDEMDYEARPGPCDDGARNLVGYVGEVGTATIRLNWIAGAHESRQVSLPLSGLDGQQTLFKREGEGGPRLAQLFGEEGRARNSISTRPRSQLPVDGVWSWELKSIDADGDERIEREEWHLTEDDTGVSGWYDRNVSRIREGGTFPCNNEGRYETVTRYDIHGQRVGDTVVLSEIRYKAEPSRCDNGMRRLDTYHGSVVPGGDQLVLTWGAGNQVLRRAPAVAAPAPAAAPPSAP